MVTSIESVVRITGITSYMLYRSPTLGACALSIVPLVAVVNRVYGNWLSKNAREVQDALAVANSVAQETLSCIRTVIAFSSERFEYKKYVDKINHQYRLNVRQVSLPYHGPFQSDRRPSPSNPIFSDDSV